MAAIAPQQPLTFNDVFEEEDIDEPKEANSVHHIRANSSIMHVKKILVANRGEIRKLMSFHCTLLLSSVMRID
ncbi:hypothetical protein BKA59DRAFT_150030 [Fusarium tricinctum]|uniref:Uncharacterized protein n=1 Tax=Fusarium tricinctum TaxID=61284 RepID=A0A8K0WDJ9_9HYPO|nr:hypothetical protein BKA59DRAFT_150030 [Fusarium tricinctum]